MCERAAFVHAVLAKEDTMAALCRRFGISRKTGYKWLRRFEAEGEAGLLERSRAPRVQARTTDESMERAIIELRLRQARGWGPKKLASALARDWPPEAIPALSTIGDILKRKGLVAPRKRRRRATPSAQPLAHASQSNRVWCADFKGWFHTRDGRRVDPLTVTDAYSRYLLGCQCLCGKTDTVHVQAVFEALFRAHGLPERIRTDNGAPFASTGLAGLSRLSVWWIRLGIVPERIRPATPSENGRHERFHRTLKAEAISPPANSPRQQQRAFNRFQRIYNEERPHEALGQTPPDAWYQDSPRPYPPRLRAPEYPDDCQVRRVRKGGQVKWRGKDLRVTYALVHQPIAFTPIGDGLWQVHYFHYLIGIFDERKMKIRAPKTAASHK